ncbi:sigma-70 family RNA polymerase sigma factor, partial [Thiolapillus sp.]|uniref:sigma-70 family RNA polymerase sigma factor n=1 Tax=Thiolapillus sp. TaxID=2017437 RepID=UPI0025FA4EFD
KPCYPGTRLSKKCNRADCLALTKDLFKEGLSTAISSLPEREQMVLSLYYDNEFNLREIGEVLGVSEARICQIHAQALTRLRSKMSDWVGDEDD